MRGNIIKKRLMSLVFEKPQLHASSSPIPRIQKSSIISDFSTIRCLNARQMFQVSDLCLQLKFYLFFQFKISHGHETKPYFGIPVGVAGQFAITRKYLIIYIRN